jgi:hypothetical protein
MLLRTKGIPETFLNYNVNRFLALNTACVSQQRNQLNTLSLSQSLSPKTASVGLLKMGD